MSDITIATVNWHCTELIEKLLCNLKEKASRPEKLKAIVIDNTNRKDSSLERLKNCPVPLEIYALDTKGLSGSRAHAYALDFVMQKLSTEFALIADPDIYVFKKGWDEFCVSMLNNSENVAVGAPYPPWKVGKYRDFPGPFFCFFRVQTIKNLQCSWQPFPKSLLGLLGKFLTRQLGRLGPVVTRNTYTKYAFIRKYSTFAEKTLGVFAPDTGYKIAQKLRQKKMNSVLFKAVLPQELRCETGLKSQALTGLAEQYELFFCNDEPFVTHKYGSSNWPWKTKFGHDKNFWRGCIEKVEDGYNNK